MAATKQAVLTGMGRCHNCGQELIEIDNRGERLNGCGAPTDGLMGKLAAWRTQIELASTPTGAQISLRLERRWCSLPLISLLRWPDAA
jgi:hypothetical protein